MIVTLLWDISIECHHFQCAFTDTISNYLKTKLSDCLPQGIQFFFFFKIFTHHFYKSLHCIQLLCFSPILRHTPTPTLAFEHLQPNHLKMVSKNWLESMKRVLCFDTYLISIYRFLIHGSLAYI